MGEGSDAPGQATLTGRRHWRVTALALGFVLLLVAAVLGGAYAAGAFRPPAGPEVWVTNQTSGEIVVELYLNPNISGVLSVRVPPWRHGMCPAAKYVLAAGQKVYAADFTGWPTRQWEPVRLDGHEDGDYYFIVELDKEGGQTDASLLVENPTSASAVDTSGCAPYEAVAQ